MKLFHGHQWTEFYHIQIAGYDIVQRNCTSPSCGKVEVRSKYYNYEAYKALFPWEHK